MGQLLQLLLNSWAQLIFGLAAAPKRVSVTSISQDLCQKSDDDTCAGNRGIPVFEIVLARSVVLLALTLPQLLHQHINPLRSER